VIAAPLLLANAKLPTGPNLNRRRVDLAAPAACSPSRFGGDRRASPITGIRGRHLVLQELGLMPTIAPAHPYPSSTLLMSHTKSHVPSVIPAEMQDLPTPPQKAAPPSNCSPLSSSSLGRQSYSWSQPSQSHGWSERRPRRVRGQATACVRVWHARGRQSRSPIAVDGGPPSAGLAYMQWGAVGSRKEAAGSGFTTPRPLGEAARPKAIHSLLQTCSPVSGPLLLRDDDHSRGFSSITMTIEIFATPTRPPSSGPRRLLSLVREPRRPT